MFRQIITTSENMLHLQLPDELVGKKIEIIVFALDSVVARQPEKEVKRTMEEARIFYKNHAVDFGTLEKWDRNELY